MNGLEQFGNFVIEDALILIPALMVVGKMLKNTPQLEDWLIPYILGVLGIAGGLSIVGANPEGVIQGILVAGAAVYGHQLFTQAKNKNKKA